MLKIKDEIENIKNITPEEFRDTCKRIGRFKLNNKTVVWLEYIPILRHMLFTGMFIQDMYRNYIDNITYVATNEIFEPVDEGMKCPYYIAILNLKDNYIRWEKETNSKPQLKESEVIL